MDATTAIFVDSGSIENRDGDETQEWYATPGDDDGEPTGKPVICASRAAAIQAAETLAASYGGIEVVVE